VYILGGQDGNNKDLSSVEMYSITDGGHVLPFQLLFPGAGFSAVVIDSMF
jgi:hypothetical protein